MKQPPPLSPASTAPSLDRHTGEPYEWSLRYASHFGFLKPDDVPLFHKLVNCDDPRAHARFAAEIGFKGVQYTYAMQRPTSEAERFGAAMEEFGLESSCILFAPIEEIQKYQWGEPGSRARDAIVDQVHRACVVASKVRSKSVNLVAMSVTDRLLPLQRETMAGHLRAASQVAQDFGLILALETMKSLPNILLRSLADSADVIRQTRHPAAKILFDTFHAHTMGDDLPLCFQEYFDLIGLVQLKNYPGRLEKGEIDFLPVLVEAIRRNYRGLVELENHWSEPGAIGECAGLMHIRTLDRRAKEIAGAPQAGLVELEDE